jgi:hypothetical protein
VRRHFELVYRILRISKTPPGFARGRIRLALWMGLHIREIDPEFSRGA